MRFPPLFTVIVATLLSACGGGSSGSTPPSPTTPSPATSTFQGTIAGSGRQSGTLTVSVQAQVAASFPSIMRWPFVATLHAQGTTVAATGSLHIAGGSTVALTGTFDSSTKVLILSGGGFTFTGSLGGSVLSGTYTGPNGATGGFSSHSTAAGTVTPYCGTFVGSPCDFCPVSTGVFNIEVSATGAVSGVYSLAGQVGYISGQVSGTTLRFTTTDGGSETATIQNGMVSGPGSLSGSTSACQ